MSYNIIRFNYSKDNKKLFDLWQELLDYPSWERMEWLYKHSYYGQPDTWLLKAESEIIGSVSLVSAYFNVWNQNLKVGLAVDFMVKKKYRSFGPALMLQKTIMKEYENLGYKIILGYPTKRGLNVVLRAGYKKLGVAKRYTKIVRTENKLKKYISNTLLRKYIAHITDFLLTSFSRNTWQNFMLKAGLIPNAKVNMEDNSKVLPFNVFCDPETEYLKWRFLSAPHRKTTLYEIKENNHIYGYISYLANNNMINIDGMYIFDFKKYADISLTKFISSMKKENVESISVSYFGNKKYKNLFRRHGFFERETNRYVVFHSQPDIEEEMLLCEDNWCLFDGDIDL